MAGWHPPVGTTTLIEPVHPEPGCESITAVVLDDDRFLVDLGASPRPQTSSFDAIASFFTPDALFRARCLLVSADVEGGQYQVVIEQLDQIERRIDRRVDIEVPCSMIAFDDAGCARSVTGRTRNVSRGGCRLVLDHRRPPGDPPTVSLELADGSLVAEAFVVACEHDEERDGDHWDYRLAFTFIDAVDRDRLAALA
jgi:hypothetical protein